MADTSRRKKRSAGGRENYLKLFNRTCDRVYARSFQYTLNHDDALMITRDAFVHMYQHIADLRRSSSVEVWQRKSVEAAFRKLLRLKRLSLIHEKEEGQDPEPMSLTQREALWSKINKLGSIDPWRLLPIPGKSSLFSVLKDRYVSDLSSMTLGDAFKTIAIMLGVVAAVVALAVFGISRLGTGTHISIEGMEEIFLDDRNYTASKQPEVEIDEDAIASMTKAAEKIASRIAYESMLAESKEAATSVENYAVSSAPLLYHQELMSSHTPVFTPAEEAGLTAGSGQLTGEMTVDMAINEMLAQLTSSPESDYAAIREIYHLVGSMLRYSDKDRSGSTEADYVSFAINSRSGDSRHYSALLAALCRARGYECELIKGSFILNPNTERERFVEHYWNKLYVNGTEYWLDLEADCSSDGSTVRENYFMAARGNALWSDFSRDHRFDK